MDVLISVFSIFLTLVLIYLSLRGIGWLCLAVRFRDREAIAEALKRDHKGSYINAAHSHFIALTWLIFMIGLVLTGLFLFIAEAN